MIFMVVALFSVASTVAQSPNTACPGFRNPTSFNTGSSQYFWSARVGDRTYSAGNYNDTTTGYHIMSTCTTAPTITGSAITSSSFDSGTDFTGQTCNHNFFDANDHRFQIITQTNAGIDQFTVAQGSSTGMPRIPPGYISSIRLGDMCSTGQAVNLSGGGSSGNNKGSEALFYTMQVTPLNALLIINYAVVARRFPHDAYDAGEFLIRVIGQNDDGSWQNMPLNDSLWYKVSAPQYGQGSSMPLGWYEGAGDPANWPCTYAYKPWAKVAINLNNYLYENVRIEMYTSDCIYSADPLYAYICGDFQAMVLAASGCPDPESDVIDTLTAPSDMISYVWYASEDGVINNFYDFDRMDTVTFRRIYPATGESQDNRYTPHTADFVLTRGAHAGDTAADQTFMCIMTSAMDPAKPVESKLYVSVKNRRPHMAYRWENNCDSTVTFYNQSYTYVHEGLTSEATYWVIYADTLCYQPIDTIWGNVVSRHFATPGRYGVKLYCETAPDATHGGCGATATFVCEALGRPDIAFSTDRHIICEGDRAHLTCTTGCDYDKHWTVDGNNVDPDTLNNNQLHIELPLGRHIITLRAVNAGGCESSYSDTLLVLGAPELAIDGNSNYICLGDSVTVCASGSDTYQWYSSPEDSALAAQQGQSTIVVSPTRSTTYYLLPSAGNPCSNEGSMFTINLIPTPIARIKASVPSVSVDNSTVSFSDVSNDRTFTTWRFSDGMTDSGIVATHIFDIGGQDSIGVWMESCNRAGCCGDTSLWLPVDNISIWFPNVFIPGEEGRFGIVSSMPLLEYEIYIYNREGLLVHRSNDPLAPWDGTDLNGSACPQGAYVYWYRYAYDDLGGFHEAHGTVTLLR